MKSYEEIKKEMDELKAKNAELQKQVHKLKYGNEESWKKEKDLAMNYLQLFGSFGGVKIPMDKEMKSAIGTHIFKEITKMLNDNTNDFMSKVGVVILRNTDYFKKIFKPVVEELVEDMDFKVNFRGTE